MFASIALVIVLVIAASDTSAGRALRQAMASLRLSWKRLLWIGALCGFAIVLFEVLHGQGLVLALQGLPELLGWFATVDLAGYLDILAAVALIAAATRLRGAWSAVRPRIAALAARIIVSCRRTVKRGLRVARRRKPLKEDSDDDRPVYGAWPTAQSHAVPFKLITI